VKSLFMGIEPSGGVIVVNLDTLQAYSSRNVRVRDGVFLSTQDLNTHGIARSQNDSVVFHKIQMRNRNQV